MCWVTANHEINPLSSAKPWGIVEAVDVVMSSEVGRKRGRSHSHDGSTQQDRENRQRCEGAISPNPGHRDLSIRYPGMTKKSFDELVSLLDEVVNEGSADQIEEEDGLIYCPVEVFQQQLCETAHPVPSSPPGASSQLILPNSPSEIQSGGMENSRIDGGDR